MSISNFFRRFSTLAIAIATMTTISLPLTLNAQETEETTSCKKISPVLRFKQVVFTGYRQSPRGVIDKATLEINIPDMASLPCNQWQIGSGPLGYSYLLKDDQRAEVKITVNNQPPIIAESNSFNETSSYFPIVNFRVVEESGDRLRSIHPSFHAKFSEPNETGFKGSVWVLFDNQYNPFGANCTNCLSDPVFRLKHPGDQNYAEYTIRETTYKLWPAR